MLGQHLESEANDSLPESRLDSLPAGLGEVYAVNFERAFPEGQEDSAWTEAKRLVELIAAAREPITVAMAAALLRCDCGQQERVLETTALLFPFRCAMAMIKVWDADSFNLLETRPGEAMVFSGGCGA